MSLGGLVIAIGMIVDSSVVITEKIEAELDSEKQLPLHKIYRAVGCSTFSCQWYGDNYPGVSAIADANRLGR